MPSIQKVRPGGKAEILVTEVEGIKLNGPNDLVFAADGTAGLHRSRHLQPGQPRPELHLRPRPRRQAERRHRLPEAGVPERRRGRGRRFDRLGRILHRSCPAHPSERQDRGPRPHARRQSDPRRHEDRRRRPPLRHRPRRQGHPCRPAERQGRRLHPRRRGADQSAPSTAKTSGSPTPPCWRRAPSRTSPVRSGACAFPDGGVPTYKGVIAGARK